jgi:3-oxoacyl-[acyl-carrier protein] reductase
MASYDDLRGKTALVTGASNGIGAATAALLGSNGVHTIVHYHRAKDEAERVLVRIREAGGDGEIIGADLSNMDGCRQLKEALKRQGRPIDLLINNAGSLVRRTPVLEFGEDLWDQVLTLNLTSAFFIAQAVLHGMVERKSGVIVNVSSVGARTGGGIGALVYCAAKGAINVMTRGLAKEFGPHGIRINAVSPGTIDTNYHRNFSTPAGLQSVVAATPLGRIGDPHEIGEVILFLCSASASFIHGEIIEINGGFFMG